MLAVKGTDPGAEYQGILNVTASADGHLGFAAHGEDGRLAVIDLDSGAKVTSLSLGAAPSLAYRSPDGG